MRRLCETASACDQVKGFEGHSPGTTEAQADSQNVLQAQQILVEIIMYFHA
jgi:hypothetical protein